MTIEGELSRALVHAQFTEDQNQIALVTELKDFYDQKIAQGLLDILPHGTAGAEMRTAIIVKEAGGHELSDEVSIRDMIHWKHSQHLDTIGSNFMKQLSSDDRRVLNSLLYPFCDMFQVHNEQGKFVQFKCDLGDLRSYSLDDLMQVKRMSEDRAISIKTAFGPLPLNTV